MLLIGEPWDAYAEEQANLRVEVLFLARGQEPDTALLDAEGRTKIVRLPRDRCNAPLLFLDLRLSLERSIDDTSTLSGFRCVRPPE